MNPTRIHQSGVLTTADIKILPLLVGENYALVLGLEGDDFAANSIVPKLSTGLNAGDAAEGTLTLAAQPIAGNTFTIGDRVYGFIDSLQTKAGDRWAEITIGATLDDTKDNVLAAINGTGNKDTPDPLVTIAAFTVNDAVITSTEVGTVGNAIATTETFTSGSNVFDAATLGTTTAGTDDLTGELIALPEIGLFDSAGSPAVFSQSGMIHFCAALPFLVLDPSGAVTSVRYHLTRTAGFSATSLSR